MFGNAADESIQPIIIGKVNDGSCNEDGKLSK